MVQRPFFSVLVTTYNRARILARCLDSCLDQTFDDFEVVVVDDGSSDATAVTLDQVRDPRLSIVIHEVNRGISASRQTAVSRARGEWLVIVDSDWELFPYTLERLHEVVQQLPPEVRMVRSRLVWDNGRVTPEFIPASVIGYTGRIKWLEAVARGSGESDAGHCIHRSVFERMPYYSDRRGATEMLWELDLAKHEPSHFIPDVLGKQHADAANSFLRGVDRRELIPRLLRDAPDMLWMAETTLAEHGPELARYGPRQRDALVKSAATQSFLVGARKKGIRYSRASLRRDIRDGMAWGTLALGVLGPRAVAYGTLGYRRWVARHRRARMKAAGP
jgi:Glycosyl transferase family 2